MQAPLRHAIAIVAVILAVPAATMAQTVSTGLFTAWTGAPNTDRATGVEVSIESAVIPLRVTAAYEWGGSAGFGVPCQPSIARFCAPEPVDHSTRLLTLGVSWPFEVAGGETWSAAVGPELILSRVAGSTRGVESDRQVATNTIMQGLGAGLDIGWRPAPESAWSLRLRSGVRGRLSLLNVECDDCFDPFDRSFFAGELGLSVGYSFND